jgi:hypothetical protein
LIADLVLPRSAAGLRGSSARWTTPARSWDRFDRGGALEVRVRRQRPVFCWRLHPPEPPAVAVRKPAARVPAAPRANAAAEAAAGAGRAGTPLSRSFWIAIGIFGLFTLASSTDAFLLLKARGAGIPLWQLPLLWAFFNGVKAAGGVPGGALADRLGRVWTIVAGWAVYALAYVGFAFAATPIRRTTSRSTRPSTP